MLHGKGAKMPACDYIMLQKTFFSRLQPETFLCGVNGHVGEAPRPESEVKKAQVKCWQISKAHSHTATGMISPRTRINKDQFYSTWQPIQDLVLRLWVLR